MKSFLIPAFFSAAERLLSAIFNGWASNYPLILAHCNRKTLFCMALPGGRFNLITCLMSHLFLFSSIPAKNFKKIFLSANIGC